MLRKQYHVRTVDGDVHAWDIHRLIRLSKQIPPTRVRLDAIPELDQNWWYADGSAAPTPRALATHMALVQQAGLSFPILLCAEGRVMDGMHRLVKAVLEHRTFVLAVRFPVTPGPDYVNIPADALPPRRRRLKPSDRNGRGPAVRRSAAASKAPPGRSAPPRLLPSGAARGAIVSPG